MTADLAEHRARQARGWAETERLRRREHPVRVRLASLLRRLSWRLEPPPRRPR